MDGPECAAVSAVRRRQKCAGGRRFSPSIPSARAPSQRLTPTRSTPRSREQGAGSSKAWNVRLPAPCSPLPLRLPAPCSPLPAPFVPLPNRREVNHLSPHRLLADLGQCDGDHHEVVAALLHPATVRPATTGRPGARLLRGAALRACHGCHVGPGHATRKSADGDRKSV